MQSLHLVNSPPCRAFFVAGADTDFIEIFERSCLNATNLFLKSWKTPAK